MAVLRRQYPTLGGRIPSLAKIVGFRNILVHNYDGIRNDVIWRIVEVDLPTLRETLERLLAEAEPP